MTERAQGWRNGIYAGIFFGAAMGLYTGAINGWLPPKSAAQVVSLAASTLVGGGVFGLLIGLFIISPIVTKDGDMPLDAGEVIEYSGFANHFLNFEGRGGRLALTQSHLVFKPHVVNIQRSELRIPLRDIASIAPARTLGLIPNGLAVTLKSGKVEKFVVNDRKKWIAMIGKR